MALSQSVKWLYIFPGLVILLHCCNIATATGTESTPNGITSPKTSANLSDKISKPFYGKGTVISGLIHENLPQPIYYDTGIPLVFQYHTPNWNKSEITFNNWYTCTSESFPYNQTCPITLYLNKIMVLMHLDFDGIHPVLSDAGTSGTGPVTAESSSAQYFAQLTGDSNFCDTIQPHFSNIWTNDLDFQLYWSALKGCQRGQDSFANFDQEISYFNQSTRFTFNKIHNNFYNIYFKAITTSNETDAHIKLLASGALQSMRTAIQGVMLGQYYAEKNRWTHASVECRQGFIPTSLVDFQKFNTSLQQVMKMNVFKTDFDLSISPDNLPGYYSQPLADCTFTSSNSFIVRVLVPVVKKYNNENLQLVKIHLIPFYHAGHECRVKLSSGRGEFGDIDNVYIYDNTNGQAYRSGCKPNKLCKISENMGWSDAQDLCVGALLSRNETDIRNYCDFQCVPKRNRKLPSVVRVASDKLVISGNTDNFTISCGNVVPVEKQFQPSEFGAMLVRLPCHCRLNMNVFNVNKTFHTGHICKSGRDLDEDINWVTLITSIVPVAFTKVGRSKTNDQLLPFENVNFREVVDEEMITKYIDPTPAQPDVKEKDDEKMKMVNYTQVTDETDDSAPSPSPHNAACTTCGGVNGVFWTVFAVIVILILSIQVYMFFVLRKMKNWQTYSVGSRFSAHSTDRILYQVDPDE